MHYVQSATAISEPVLSLKLSLLRTDAELWDNFKMDKNTKLLIHENHRQEILDKLATIPLIPSSSLLAYMRLTREITTRALKQYKTFLDKKDPEIKHDYRELRVFRGIGNTNYYRQVQDRPDFLSLYTNEPELRDNYYEPKILNSYSLSNVCAEKFYSQKSNQRRVLVTTTYETFEKIMFASFITSPSFRNGQFELLSLASLHPLYIRQQQNNEIMASFEVDG